jgi:WD40 repeat protein/DNA-binding SARP family transcriptional activator
MDQLHIRLFQGFEASSQDAGLLRFRTAHTRALLAYLSVESGRAHRRDTLAGLLWPDHPERAALHNLSQTLMNLRGAIGDKAASPPFLLTTYQTIQFNLSSRAFVDVIAFEKAHRAIQKHQHEQLAACEPCLQQLQDALSLYRGPLLADTTFGGSSLFEEWLLLTRERLQRQASALLEQLIDALIKREQYSRAEYYARQLVSLDPLQESAHQHLIRILALAGQRSSALQQFESYRELLQNELGLEPEPELLALVGQIRAGTLVRAVASARGASDEAQTIVNVIAKGRGGADRRSTGVIDRAPFSTAQISGELPDLGPIYGRHKDMARLSQWLLDEHCRVIVLVGMGGLGKTTLAAMACKELAGQFDHLVWHSLLNAPPLNEWLTYVLQALAPEAFVEPGASLAQRLALLLDLLRQQRCLLVLDNFETILQGEDYAGMYRHGYEDYERLIDYLAQHGHQSCLLITSREQPRNYERLALQTPLVRTLRLSGLDHDAGQALLQAHGLGAANELTASLVERYSGNPLALRLIAMAIHDLFAGDAKAFLHDAVFIFDDIRMVIEQQFERLSQLEQSILLWLALEREPLSPRTLSTDCLYAIPQRMVLEALRSLQRRALLEERGGHFTLSNVVIEYLTDRLIATIYEELRTGQLKLANSHGLLRAQGKAYVRQTQQRLLIGPLAEQLQASLGPVGLLEHCRQLLDQLRQVRPLQPGYAAGNLLNILVYLHYDLQGLDFSQLCAWQAMLQGVIARQLNFANADLRGAIFTDASEGGQGMVLSPDGSFLVTGTTSGLIRFWSTSNWQPWHSVTAHRICIWGLAFSNDGSLLATASEEPTVKLWNGQTGAYIRSLEGHQGAVRAVAFSPDDRLLASSGLDGTVRLWSTQNGELQRVLDGHNAMVRSVAFSPDGVHLVSGGDDGTIGIWHVATGERCATLHGHSDVIKAVAFSPVGPMLISTSHDGTLRLWESETGICRKVINAHSNGITALAVSRDGTLLATAGLDQTIRIWDGVSGRLRHTIEQQHIIRSLAFSADSTYLISCHEDQTMRVWEVQSGRVLQNVHGYMNWVHTVDYSPDMRYIATGGTDSVVRLWDTTNPEWYIDLHGHAGRLNSLAFSPDSTLIASCSQDGSVRIWDAHRRTLLRTFADHGSDVYAVGFSPDNQLIASGGTNAAILLWETASGHIQRAMSGHSMMINDLAFSPDGRLLATASDDRTIGLWDTTTGACLTFLKGHEAIVSCVAFSPCGRFLASGSYDQTVRVWRVEEQAVHLIYHEHKGTVSGVAFSPDSRLLISGSYDRTVQAWTVEGGITQATYAGHTAAVSAVAFRADGRTFMSGSFDGTWKEWDVFEGKCLRSQPMPLPYAGTTITGVTGITPIQRASLLALGARE